jgi:hypothetical protein
MAAGLGFKTFAVGEVLTAADTNGYLMQGVLVFASAAARDAAITSPQEGQFAYLKDTNVTTYYTGSAWSNLDTTGMVNPMTTTGDTIYSSSGSTPARLGIGSTGQVLTVAGGVPTWASASGATANFSLLNTGGTNLTGGSTVTVSGISGMSTLIVLIQDAGLNTSTGEVRVRLNTDSTSKYTQFGSSQIYDSGSFNPAAFSTLSYSAVSAFYVGRNNSVSGGGGRLCAGLVLTGCNSSGQKMVQSIGTGDGAVAGSQRQDIGVGFYNSSSTISSVSVNADYTFNAGKVYIYGSAV